MKYPNYGINRTNTTNECRLCGKVAPSSCTGGLPCSVIPSFIVEAGLGQFGVRETENDCRVIARCDTFEDAIRVARLLVAEASPNA